MKEISIQRIQHHAHGTPGVILLGQLNPLPGLVSLEEAWKDNARNISCIPAGSYLVEWAWSNKHKENRYFVRNVPGRDGVQFHIGNDEDDTEGCVLPGSGFDASAGNGRPYIIGSKAGLAVLYAYVERPMPFRLHVYDLTEGFTKLYDGMNGYRAPRPPLFSPLPAAPQYIGDDK